MADTVASRWTRLAAAAARCATARVYDQLHVVFTAVCSRRVTVNATRSMNHYARLSISEANTRTLLLTMHL